MGRNELEQPNWENTAAVIGGNGAWGKITKLHLEALGFHVVPADILVDEEETLNNNIAVIRESRVVCFSIWPEPAKHISEIITTAVERGAIIAGQIVLEDTSVKNPIIGSLRILDSLGVSACSVHPLIDPRQSPIEGENVWVMEVGGNSVDARCLAESLFISMGMVIHHTPLDSHDADMSEMQGSSHVINRAADLTFWRMGIPTNKLRDKGPANFRMVEDSRIRTRMQEPRMSVTLIASMLSHPRGREFLHSFVENLQLLERLIDENLEEAVRVINESAIFLKGGE